jgi:hypothetical protein
MSSSIRRIATRVAFIAALSQLIATACDPTAPNDPNDQKKLLDAEASRGISVSSLTASAVSWYEVDLTWPTTGGVTGYQIFRSTTGAAGTYTQLATITSNVGSYADRAVDGSTQYCYQVRSYKTAGRNTTYSAFSSAACATTLEPPPPPIVAPTETDALPQAYRILIKWKDNSTNEDGFRVERSAYLTNSWYAVSVPANSTSFYWSGSDFEQQWCFRVTAFNATFSSLPSTPDCTIVPAPPTDLSAAADGQSIALSWIDRSAVEDGYTVSRSAEGGPWTDIATLPPNAGSYRDFAVGVDITYSYHVQALKDGGYSYVSNDATGVIPISLPAAPLDAHAGYYISGDGRTYYLALSWQDLSSNEAGFAIEFSPDGETEWTQYVGVLANSTGFTQLFGIEDFSPSGCFRVSAVNALGASAPSNIACADPTEVIQQIISGYNVVSGATAPTRPNRVKKGRITKGSVK